jgi:hypothetical protein
VRRRWIVILILAAAVVLIRVGGDLGPGAPAPDDSAGSAPPATSPEPTPQGTYRPGVDDLEQLLAKVSVLADRPSVTGYDRDCGSEHACSFGQPWSDDVDVELGHNGCDTRIICTLGFAPGHESGVPPGANDRTSVSPIGP